MGAQQDFDIVQAAQVIVVDGFQPHAPQPLTLHPVVNNVAEAVERLAFGQLFLSLAYGSGHAKAEPAAAVYLDLHDLSFLI